MSVPGVALADSTVYSILAMVLADGEPALDAFSSADAVAPPQLPETDEPAVDLELIALPGAGLTLAADGFLLRTRRNKIAAKRRSGSLEETVLHLVERVTGLFLRKPRRVIDPVPVALGEPG